MKEILTNENETWRTVPGYPCYKVSDQGRVLSLRNPKNPKILKPSQTKQGYCHVTLTSGDKFGEGEQKEFRVHRLVAMCFIENPSPKKRRDVGHWDSTPTNNNVENLYWTYPLENSANPITVQRRNDARPEAIKKTSKAVYVYDDDYVQVSAFTSTAAASRVLNASQGNISSSANGSLPKYLNRIWSYDPELTKEKRETLLVERQEQRVKNTESTMKAVKKYYHTNRENNTEAYQKWLEKARIYSKNYYHRHPDEVKAKNRKRYYERKEEERRNKAEQP